jgi:hypothetical protein
MVDLRPQDAPAVISSSVSILCWVLCCAGMHGGAHLLVGMGMGTHDSTWVSVSPAHLRLERIPLGVVMLPVHTSSLHLATPAALRQQANCNSRTGHHNCPCMLLSCCCPVKIPVIMASARHNGVADIPPAVLSYILQFVVLKQRLGQCAAVSKAWAAAAVAATSGLEHRWGHSNGWRSWGSLVCWGETVWEFYHTRMVHDESSTTRAWDMRIQTLQLTEDAAFCCAASNISNWPEKARCMLHRHAGNPVSTRLAGARRLMHTRRRVLAACSCRFPAKMRAGHSKSVLSWVGQHTQQVTSLRLQGHDRGKGTPYSMPFCKFLLPGLRSLQIEVNLSALLLSMSWHCCSRRLLPTTATGSQQVTKSS